jgi:hypothetical protein
MKLGIGFSDEGECRAWQADIQKALLRLDLSTIKSDDVNDKNATPEKAPGAGHNSEESEENTINMSDECHERSSRAIIPGIQIQRKNTIDGNLQMKELRKEIAAALRSSLSDKSST